MRYELGRRILFAIKNEKEFFRHLAFVLAQSEFEVDFFHDIKNLQNLVREKEYFLLVCDIAFITEQNNFFEDIKNLKARVLLFSPPLKQEHVRFFIKNGIHDFIHSLSDTLWEQKIKIVWQQISERTDKKPGLTIVRGRALGSEDINKFTELEELAAPHFEILKQRNAKSPLWPQKEIADRQQSLKQSTYTFPISQALCSYREYLELMNRTLGSEIIAFVSLRDPESLKGMANEASILVSSKKDVSPNTRIATGLMPYLMKCYQTNQACLLSLKLPVQVGSISRPAAFLIDGQTENTAVALPFRLRDRVLGALVILFKDPISVVQRELIEELQYFVDQLSQELCRVDFICRFYRRKQIEI